MQMSRKSNVEVSIGGKVYTLSGYEAAEGGILLKPQNQ